LMCIYRNLFFLPFWLVRL